LALGLLNRFVFSALFAGLFKRVLTMKILLVVFIFCTTALAQAQSLDIYAVESLSCSTGAALNSSTNSSDSKYKISADNTQLIRETTLAGSTITETFSLNQVGKNAFMATPDVVRGNAVYFFVTISEDRSQLSIHVADSSGTTCGGGLVITNLIRKIGESSTFPTVNSTQFL
jgi:hypothetical protein